MYYPVRKFPAYGRLAKRDLDDLLAGARVEPGEAKRDPLDFALWKSAKPGEPWWASPWGAGRPGWHIECSAMALAHLGVPFDIHAGGKDLIFPHHTNEIAQSVAAAGADLDPEGYAHYWMHNGFVEIDHEKMSKSLGNVFTIREVIDRFDAEVLRLALLGTHYRHTISYTESLLTEAEQRLVYLYETLGRAAEHAAGAEAFAGSVLVDRVRGALDDDLNTPQALAALGEAFVEANTIADRRRKSADERARLAAFVRDVGRAGASLGLLQRAPAEALLAIRDRAAARLGIDPAWVEARLAARNSARRAKDYALGDAIRDELQARGIRVQDGPAGATWRIG